MDYTLREQVAQEAVAAAQLVPFLTGVPAMPNSSPTEPAGWEEKEWLQWFEAVLREGRPGSIARDLTAAIAQALAQTNYPSANFLTRRLAAELAVAEWSEYELFIPVKQALCDSGNFSEQEFDMTKFTHSLNAVFGEKPKSLFTVAVTVAPVALTRTVAKKFTRGLRLLLDSAESGRQVLTGIEIDLDASHVDEAAALGIETARRLLEDLRLIFYVQIHLCGSVRVTRTEPQMDLHLSLPQPFWTKAPGCREDRGFRRDTSNSCRCFQKTSARGGTPPNGTYRRRYLTGQKIVTLRPRMCGRH